MLRIVSTLGKLDSQQAIGDLVRRSRRARGFSQAELATAAGVGRGVVRRFAGATVLVVERYDRLRPASGEATRLHQEDTCQALGIEPGRKYEEQGGPGIADVLNLLRRVSADAGRDVLSFLERTAFDLGIANLDAHGCTRPRACGKTTRKPIAS